MALIGLRQDSQWEYESKLDPARGTEKATRFGLKTIPNTILVMLRDKATRISPNPEAPGGVVAEFAANQAQWERVRYGLAYWKNFLDDAGNEIQLQKVRRTHGDRTYEIVSEDSMQCIHLDVIAELSEEIEKGNTAAEEERKSAPAGDDQQATAA